jgi:tRNA(Ile)-lysidine synthase
VRVHAGFATGFSRRPRGQPGQLPDSAFLNADLAGTRALELRAWRDGDRLDTLGGQPAKLQDIFTNAKVPRALRNRIPVLASGDEVVWIPGGWLARSWAVHAADAPSVRVDISPL